MVRGRRLDCTRHRIIYKRANISLPFIIITLVERISPTNNKKLRTVEYNSMGSSRCVKIANFAPLMINTVQTPNCRNCCVFFAVGTCATKNVKIVFVVNHCLSTEVRGRFGKRQHFFALWYFHYCSSLLLVRNTSWWLCNISIIGNTSPTLFVLLKNFSMYTMTQQLKCLRMTREKSCSIKRQAWRKLQWNSFIQMVIPNH